MTRNVVNPCPKCQTGSVFALNDFYGDREICSLCSYSRDLVVVDVHSRQTKYQLKNSKKKRLTT